MTSIDDKQRFAGSWLQQALLKLSWEAEFFGAGMFETLTVMYPKHAENLTACATMERFNARYCEPFGRGIGTQVSLPRAEKLERWGAAVARRLPTFNSVARLMIFETPLANAMYRQLGRSARESELKVFADDFVAHESAMRDWFRSELEGRSDGGEKIFAYLDGHGISRQAAVTSKIL